jgi:uncharacterized membrane protein YgdD (TMEM256/DUF423 family)
LIPNWASIVRAIVLVLAGLSGALGVTVYALAAHRAGAGTADQFALVNAAIMMLVHGAAALGLVALAPTSAGNSWRWHGAALVMLVGAMLFGGAVALPKLVGLHLVGMAAPTGGMLTILAWLAVVINALLDILGSGRDLR